MVSTNKLLKIIKFHKLPISLNDLISCDENCDYEVVYRLYDTWIVKNNNNHNCHYGSGMIENKEMFYEFTSHGLKQKVIYSRNIKTIDVNFSLKEQIQKELRSKIRKRFEINYFWKGIFLI